MSAATVHSSTCRSSYICSFEDLVDLSDGPANNYTAHLVNQRQIQREFWPSPPIQVVPLQRRNKREILRNILIGPTYSRMSGSTIIYRYRHSVLEPV